ncbi:FAD-binding protein [Glaciecola sp. MF2-115]|uniref:FAD-binding protein n=1 Tax=Glaciecola sp. MF2-115 TaxID=3384827 RepID=UPI0039A27F77
MSEISEILSTLKSNARFSSSILDNEEASKLYLKGTEGIERSILGAIKVNRHEDIALIFSAVSELEHSKRIKLYPISTGNNWGYGTSLPNESARAVIIDLSDLAKITVVNAELGHIAVEPGVTQESLARYFAENDLPFMVPVTGAGPNASILGNALERGYGITPHQDHFGAVNDLKAYLPNGEHYMSPLGEMLTKANADEFGVNTSYKWNVGPYLDGLFTQSGLGIVYEVTIRVKRQTESFDSFYINYEEENNITDAYDFVRETLERYDGIVGSINLMDKRRLISMLSENPNLQTSSLLNEQQITQISKKKNIPAWTVIGTIYGDKEIVLAAKNRIKMLAKLKSSKIIFSNDLLVRMGKFVFDKLPSYVFQNVHKQLNSLEKGIEIMQGKPNTVALKLAYWRNKKVRPQESSRLDPAKDGCGLLWYAPLIPMKKEKLIEYVAHVRSTCSRYGIDPMITFTNLKHDLIDSTVPLLFDKDDPIKVDLAKRCLSELVEKGLSKGYVPYRLNIEQQKVFFDETLSSHRLMQGMYSHTDPNRILQVGRYGK